MSKMCTLAALGLAGILSVVSAAASAAGFFIAEQSVKGLGNAFAGWAASAEDASTIFYNPAGLTRLDRQFTAAVSVIRPNSKFSGTATSPSTGRPVSPFPTNAPADGGNAGETVAVPNLAYAGRVTDALRWGLGVFAPWGLATNYDPGWVGRYHAIESNLKTVNINPAIAYKVPGTGLSLGGGVSAEYADATLTNKIDICAVAGADGQCDAVREVKGDDWAFGFNLGLLFEFDERSRIGAQYRSRMDHKLDGKIKYQFSPATPAALLGVAQSFYINANADAKLNLPDIASFSAYYEFTQAPVAIMGDISWFNWDRLDTVTIKPDAGVEVPLVLDYQDSWRYSVGFIVNPRGAWKGRLGFAYDESPVKNAQTRTARIPDNDRTWFSIGFGWAATDSLDLDLAYAHLVVKNAKINNLNAQTADIPNPALLPAQKLLTGSYDSDVDILGAQLTWKF